MKYIYTLYIWTVGIFFFVLFAILAVLGMQMVGAKKYSPIFRKSMRLLLYIAFIPVKVTGKEKLKKGETYLFMPNHVSILDAVILTAILPEHTVAVEEKKNFSYPIYGWLNTGYGNIPIDRESVMKSKQSFKIAGDRLKNGQNMIVFPEGGRTFNGKLRPFKSLLFLTAKQAGKAIVPLGLNGIYELNKKGSFWMNPHKVSVNFGEIISEDLVSKLEVDELKEETRNRLLSLLYQKYK